MLRAYLIPLFVAAVSIQTWFKPGTVIAGGDLLPPLAPGREYLSYWNHFTGGEGTPSFEIVAGAQYETIRFLVELGLSEGVAQRIWLTGLFAGSTAAVVFFVLALTRSPFAAGVGGILAGFNAYRLQAGADPVPMAALILAGFLGGFIVRAGLRRDVRSGTILFTLVSVGTGFVFTNPPHVLLVGIWIVVSVVIAGVVGGRESLRAALAFLLRALPLVLLVNLWWVVPVSMTIFGPEFHERFAAASPEAWAWTHRRASLANAITLNTAWGWDELPYYPYAARLARMPFALFRYFLPVLALVGAAAARGRERRAAFVMIGVGALVVGVAKGLHPPLAEVNRWLYRNVPGFNLFREPSKVLLLLVIVFAVLGGAGVARLVGTRGRLRGAAAGAAVFLVAGAVAYAHPLVTGEVVPDRRPLLPPAHVRVPDEWREAAAFVNALPSEGKLLVLPVADFYQLPTTWGYYGVPFTRWAIQRPVLEPLPGGYFRPTGSVAELITSIQRDLLSGRGTEALPKLRALGVRYVLLRRDLNRAFPGRDLGNPNRLAEGLARVPGLQVLRTFGILRLYELAAGIKAEVFPARAVGFGGPDELIPTAVSVLSEGAAVVGVADAPEGIERKGVWSPGGTVEVFRVDREQLRRVETRFTPERLIARLSDPLRLTLAGRPLAPLPPSLVRFPRPPVGIAALSLGKRTFLLPPDGRGWVELGLVTIPRETVARVWAPSDVRPIDLRSVDPVGDCNRYDRRTAEEVKLSASVLEGGGRPTLRLVARDHAACAAFPIDPFEPAALYRIRFEYRGVEGIRPRACLWQEGVERCAPLPSLDPSPGWHRLDRTVRPDPDATAVRLFFYADGTGEGLTVTEYRGARVELLSRMGVRRVATVGWARAGHLQLAKGESSLDIQSPLVHPGPIDLGSVGPVGDCNRYDRRTAEEVKFSASVLEGGGRPTLRLVARDHAACAAFPIDPFEPAALYRIRFEYRGVEGIRPRACLWQEGVERCAPLPSLDPSPGWHRLDRTVRPDPDATAVRLFFYADGTGEGLTVTEYRGARVTLAPTLDVMLLGASGSTELPDVAYEKVSPTEFRVRVSGALTPFLLALTETFAPGWRVQAPRRDASELRHVLVNGYANGWLIPWTGSYELRITYGPEDLARAARWVSFVAVLILTGFPLARWLVGRRRRRANAGAS